MNNCIIYRDEHAESTICPVCGVTLYKKRKKAPQKVVWYFPITPRLQRYFADPKVAKLLRRHADREEKKREDDANDPEINKKDKMLSHPKDASQWQALNFEYPEFGRIQGTSCWARAPMESIRLAAREAHIAPGLC